MYFFCSQQKHHSTEHLAQEVRITLKSLSSLTYNCTDEHHDALSDLNDKLQHLMNNFRAILPHEDGILLRPHIRKKLKLSRQKKASQSIKSLPLPSKRGRKKQDATFRNRVGRKAQNLRKVKCIVYGHNMHFLMLWFITSAGCSANSEKVQSSEYYHILGSYTFYWTENQQYSTSPYRYVT